MPALRRWLPTIALAVLLALGCVAAGLWQWQRHEERSAAVAVVQDNYAAEPVSLDSVVPGPGTPLPEDDVWRPVTVTGRYLPVSVLLRNRPVNGQPGFHVLAPFLIGDGRLAGTVLVVDRGWVPTGDDSSSADGVPAAPTGTVGLVVRLRAAEHPAARGAPSGQVHAIAPDQVRQAAGSVAADGWTAGSTLDLYGGVVSEDGERADGLGRLPQPATSLGSHLSYAFQWWVFALGALVGCVVLLRREHLEDRAAQDDVGTERPVRAHRRTAEEEEDALLDAQR